MTIIKITALPEIFFSFLMNILANHSKLHFLLFSWLATIIYEEGYSCIYSAVSWMPGPFPVVEPTASWEGLGSPETCSWSVGFDLWTRVWAALIWWRVGLSWASAHWLFIFKGDCPLPLPFNDPMLLMVYVYIYIYICNAVYSWSPDKKLHDLVVSALPCHTGNNSEPLFSWSGNDMYFDNSKKIKQRKQTLLIIQYHMQKVVIVTKGSYISDVPGFIYNCWKKICRLGKSVVWTIFAVIVCEGQLVQAYTYFYVFLFFRLSDWHVSLLEDVKPNWDSTMEYLSSK